MVIPTGHVQDRIVPPPEAALALYPLGRAAAACPSDIVARISLIRQLGGFEEHFTGERQLYEDQAFFAKLYQAAPVLYSSRLWLNYRQRPESCVASVKEAGRYHAVRRYFLAWLEDYLAARPAVDPRVAAALGRAKWRYDHPQLHRFLTLPARLRPYLSKARRKLRRSIRAAALPASR